VAANFLSNRLADELHSALNQSFPRRGQAVNEWKLVQNHPSEGLARLHFFSVKKKHASGEIEARITVKEFATAKTSDMQFFASADLELNQSTLRFQPCGWSETLVGALGECLRNLRRFDYETEQEASAAALPSDCGR
jgi:hypothetical protein